MLMASAGDTSIGWIFSRELCDSSAMNRRRRKREKEERKSLRVRWSREFWREKGRRGREGERERDGDGLVKERKKKKTIMI